MYKRIKGLQTTHLQVFALIGHFLEAKKGKNCMKPSNLIKDFKFQNNSYKVGPN